MKKSALQFLPFFLPLLFFSCTKNTEHLDKSRPNVILIMTDDQGYGDLACHGNPFIKTPNLDALYGESLRLTNFHVGTTCSPTRAALMTGLNCNRVGVWHTIAGRSQLSSDYKTMAQVFADSDYETGMFGKWHLGDSYPFRPHDRGFAEAFYHGGGGVWQGPDYWDNDYFDDTYFRNGIPEKTSGYCTDVWFDATMDFIEQNQDKPFFTYLATNAPHGPFHVDSSYIEPYMKYDDINPNFYGMITNIDDNMGRLLKKLDDLNLSDNTILIFMTDNGTARGASFDQQGFLTKGYNANMRGQKGSMYEGGHRVPFFIRWPEGGINQANDVDVLTAHVDILPTLIDLLGLNTPESTDFDGESIASIIKGDTPEDKWKNRVLITDTQRQEYPEKWKMSATMMDQWRLINGDELFNISDDPEQRNDIANLHPDIVKQLRADYEEWWKELSPEFGKFTRAELGSENDETVVLYAHDWHEAENNLGAPNLSGNGSHMTPWNHTHIRNGQLINGYWSVQVLKEGTYTFELRRWPRELDKEITAGIPMKDAVPGGSPMPEGKALKLNRARIQVGDAQDEIILKAGDKLAQFHLDLKPGMNEVKTWFEGDNDIRLGAYYVYIDYQSK